MKQGVLYYHFATSDLFAYEATTHFIYESAHNDLTSITPRGVGEFLNSRFEVHPEINTWSYQTRKSLVTHYLSALRDFGILEGKARKKIRRPMIELKLFIYVASVLKDCGTPARNILTSDDFKLFLLSPTEVESRFAEANQKNKVKFTKSGKIVSLEFPWETTHDYIKTLG